MGLLNRTKKPTKVICPSCGKANVPSLVDDGPRRCKICRSILPGTMTEQPGGDIDFAASEAARPSSGPAPEVVHETFDMNGLSMTNFDRAPQGRAALDALDAAPAEPESFDLGGLEFGEPSLPKPSSND